MPRACHGMPSINECPYSVRKLARALRDNMAASYSAHALGVTSISRLLRLIRMGYSMQYGYSQYLAIATINGSMDHK